VIGKPARRAAAAAASLQTVLGAHHDAVGAEAWLRRQAVAGSPRERSRAGELRARQRRRQQELRRQWRAPANRVDQKRIRRWMR
jgi:CHAD domain-containing protein